jgi:hypothetical protein
LLGAFAESGHNLDMSAPPECIVNGASRTGGSSRRDFLGDYIEARERARAE